MYEHIEMTSPKGRQKGVGVKRLIWTYVLAQKVTLSSL